MRLVFPAFVRSRLRDAFVRDVTRTFLVQVVSVCLAVAGSAIVARWLGPGGKGVVALALLLPAMLSLLLNAGIGVANVYFAGSRRLSVPKLTANSVAFALMGTIAGVAIVAVVVATGVLGRLVPGVPARLVVVAMLALPTGLLGMYFNSILLGLQRIRVVNILSLSASVVALVLSLALVVVLRLGALGAVLASLGAGVFTTVAGAFQLRRLEGAFRPRWEWSVMRPVLAFGIRGHVANVFQFFNYRLDMLLVNYFLGVAGVGIYTVSVALAEMLWDLPNAVGYVIFPKAAASSPEFMNTFTPRVCRITLALTAVGAVAIALLGKLGIRLVYSQRFLGAYVPMLALLPGVALLGAAKVLTNEIAGRGYPHYNSMNSGICLVLTVIFDLVLIPRYGVLGASLASSISYGATFAVAIYFYRLVSRRPCVASVPEASAA